jgi:hypothetical protein
MALLTPEADHRSTVRNVSVSAFGAGHDLERYGAAAAAFAAYGTDSQRRFVYQALAPYAGTHLVVGGCAAYFGPVDYHLGILAAALAEPSAEHFRAAIEAARKLGAQQWEDLAAAARARLDTADTRACFRLEGSTWRLAYGGVEVHLPDAKGLRDLAALLTTPGREIHVYTLLGREVPVTGSDPVLDHEAKQQYRRRVEELREAIEQADVDEDVHPALGSHLTTSTLLGVRCSYQSNEAIRWELDP